MTDNRERIEALKAQIEPFRFDPKQKRDAHGRWDDGGGLKSVRDELEDRLNEMDKEAIRRAPGPSWVKERELRENPRPAAKSIAKKLAEREGADQHELIRDASDDELRQALKELPTDYTPGSSTGMAKIYIDQELKRRGASGGGGGGGGKLGGSLAGGSLTDARAAIRKATTTELRQAKKDLPAGPNSETLKKYIDTEIKYRDLKKPLK